jgi:OLD-like protein
MVVLVEGTSDKVALETLAERQGRDLAAEGIEVVAMGGAQAIGRYLERFPEVRVTGLCDAGEEPEFRRAFERACVAPGFFVCRPDLEAELIRALGAERVLEVVEAHGDLPPFRTLQKQVEWRGRPVEDQLRRFMGSGGRRKTRYARYLVEALDLERVPSPLEGALAQV